MRNLKLLRLNRVCLVVCGSHLITYGTVLALVFCGFVWFVPSVPLPGVRTVEDTQIVSGLTVPGYCLL